MKKTLAILLTLISTQAFAETLPQGYEKLPGKNTEARGDFDGNGSEDVVHLLTSDKENAVFVSFAEGRNVKITPLDKKEKVSLTRLPGSILSASQIACTVGGTDNDDRAKNLCDASCNCKSTLTDGDIIRGSVDGINWFWFFDKGAIKMIWAK